MSIACALRSRLCFSDRDQTDIGHCTFLVDSYFPGATTCDDEPDYVLDQETWEMLKCEPFLDVARTGTVGRLLWLPDWPIIPERHRRKWGEYCLLRRGTVQQERPHD